jgi:hypothetical protein
MRLQGLGANPFGSDNCPQTPTPTPTATPTATEDGGFCPAAFSAGDTVGQDSGTGTPCPAQQTQTAIAQLTPTATLTPLQELAQFGINVVGCDTTEISEILAGSRDTGLALQLQYGGASRSNSFFRVMFSTGRNRIDVECSDAPGYYCFTDNNVIAPVQSRILCYADVILTKYTVVHEYGHVFVGRTGGYVAGTGTFYGLVNIPIPPPTATQGFIADSNGLVVMGNRIDPTTTPPQMDWVRGNRGWGSAAVQSPSQPCSFQQNPYTVLDWEVTATPAQTQTVRERDEAAADMFLNWVYSKIGQGGFANADYRNITDCVSVAPTDASLPGDARRNYMETVVMPTLATYIPTSTPTP